jgi:hypothetical protein
MAAEQSRRSWLRVVVPSVRASLRPHLGLPSPPHRSAERGFFRVPHDEESFVGMITRSDLVTDRLQPGRRAFGIVAAGFRRRDGWLGWGRRGTGVGGLVGGEDDRRRREQPLGASSRPRTAPPLRRTDALDQTDAFARRKCGLRDAQMVNGAGSARKKVWGSTEMLPLSVRGLRSAPSACSSALANARMSL